MPEPDLPGRGEVVFVVRMWRESAHTNPRDWRGLVESTVSHRRHYFSNMGAMCEFMLTERDGE